MRTCAGSVDLTKGLEHVLFILGVEARTGIVAFKLELDFVLFEVLGIDHGTSREHLAFVGEFDGVLRECKSPKKARGREGLTPMMFNNTCLSLTLSPHTTGGTSLSTIKLSSSSLAMAMVLSSS